MKNNIKILIVTLFLGLLTNSCDEFLDVPPDAQLTDEIIFSSYNTFQGFLDTDYELINDPNNTGLVITANMACESASNSTASPAYTALNTSYINLGVNGRSIWQGVRGADSQPFRIADTGLYDWWPYGCRIANLALANLDLLTNATQEEKDKIEGQALFFRAYLNFSILSAYGSIPYIDQVYDQDNIRQPRYYTDTQTGKKDYQAASEKAARDLRRAADLLPVSWGENDLGRITKGAALGLLTKVLLYAGSPLMEEVATKGLVTSAETPYNKEYMTRAAETAAELIKLNAYQLTPFGNVTAGGSYLDGEGYKKMFTTNDGTVPYTSEIIFKRWGRGTSSGQGLFNNTFSRMYAKGPLGNQAGSLETPLIEFMDKFEMKDGTQYKPGNTNVGGYDDNKQKFFYERDPRFDFNYYLHDEKVGTYTCSFEDLGTLNFAAAKGPFMMSKYWYPGADPVNKNFGKYFYGTPLIRLADVYLMYAEAVFEATGNPDASIGGVLTARAAMNAVRNRAKMPDYNPATYAVARTSHGELATDAPFRSAYRNERAVELAYEGHLWWDLRRWKRMHRINDKVYALNFTKAYTGVSRVLVQPFLFELRHYWLPFPTGDTQVYKDFPQNPGW
jgi:starch-binding outer membrane protein, SusD/RagB family